MTKQLIAAVLLLLAFAWTEAVKTELNASTEQTIQIISDEAFFESEVFARAAERQEDSGNLKISDAEYAKYLETKEEISVTERETSEEGESQCAEGFKRINGQCAHWVDDVNAINEVNYMQMLELEQKAAQGDAALEKSEAKRDCWEAGHVCWDDQSERGCNVKCCSGSYHQATSGPNKGKDVCKAETGCWPAGHKCWNNMGQDSCAQNCCSREWEHNGQYDVCKAPGKLYTGVVGFTKGFDNHMRRDVVYGQIDCWPEGTPCWNNDGPKSCWRKCCSKNYYHNGKTDVCGALPKDNKCLAQYSPCWDKNPVPPGKTFKDQDTGKDTPYPSCFQCCARIADNTHTRWPAWTEYYIDDGTYGPQSRKTKWYDALLAGAKALNPVQDFIDHMIPANGRPKRGGRPVQEDVAASIGKMAAKQAGKAIGKVMGAAGPVGAIAGAAFTFLFNFFVTLFLPKWDLCD